MIDDDERDHLLVYERAQLLDLAAPEQRRRPRRRYGDELPVNDGEVDGFGETGWLAQAVLSRMEWRCRAVRCVGCFTSGARMTLELGDENEGTHAVLKPRLPFTPFRRSYVNAFVDGLGRLA